MWRQRKGELPEDWIVCRDSPRQLSTGRLYDLRAFPTIYLLDKAKRVVLKDATFETVEEWLEQHDALQPSYPSINKKRAPLSQEPVRYRK